MAKTTLDRTYRWTWQAIIRELNTPGYAKVYFNWLARWGRTNIA